MFVCSLFASRACIFSLGYSCGYRLAAVVVVVVAAAADAAIGIVVVGGFNGGSTDPAHEKIFI